MQREDLEGDPSAQRFLDGLVDHAHAAVADLAEDAVLTQLFEARGAGRVGPTIQGIRLIAGREFTDADRETTRRVAVISRTLARRHWPERSPLGEHLLVGRDALEIVGVCADVKQFGLEAAGTADLYVPLRQMPDNQAPFVAARVYWVVQTTDEPLAISRLAES